MVTRMGVNVTGSDISVVHSGSSETCPLLIIYYISISMYIYIHIYIYKYLSIFCHKNGLASKLAH